MVRKPSNPAPRNAYTPSLSQPPKSRQKQQYASHNGQNNGQVQVGADNGRTQTEKTKPQSQSYQDFAAF